MKRQNEVFFDEKVNTLNNQPSGCLRMMKMISMSIHIPLCVCVCLCTIYFGFSFHGQSRMP